MQELLTRVLDIIFPPTKVERLFRSITPETIANLYTPGKHREIIYLCDYANPLVKSLILENKFSANQRAAKILSSVFYIWASAQTKPTIYIAVPLSRKRQRERGHNQVATFLNLNKSRINIQNNLLERVAHREAQTKLNKSERENNLVGAFVGSEQLKSIVPGTQIILLDDVVTTGTTLLEAKKALLKKVGPGVDIICLALAH